MAATTSPSKMKHSRFLFIHENGDPMIFYMRPCAERSSLKPEIEHGGGEVTAKVVKNSIKLAGDADYISTDDYHSTRFIKDCVKANKILDLETYRLNISKSLKSQIQNAVEDTVSDISDDESDLTRIYRTKSRDFKGRMAFKTEEDIAMLKYIIDNQRQKDIQGKALYKEMELQKVTTHSAESMSCRLRKVIMPNLDKYDIDKTWKHKLTGDPKYSESKAAKSSTLCDRVTVEGCVDSVKSPASKVPCNKRQSNSDSPDDEVTFKQTNWISKDKGKLFSKSYSKRDRVKMLRQTHQKSESSSKKCEDDSSDTVMTDEDNFDVALINAANVRKSSDKISSPLHKNLRSQTLDKVNTGSPNSSPNKRQVPSSGGDNNDNIDSSRKSKRLHPENGNKESMKNHDSESPVKKLQKIVSTRSSEQTESTKKPSDVTPPKKQNNKTKDKSDCEEASPSRISNNTSTSVHKTSTDMQNVSIHSSPQKHPSSPKKTVSSLQKASSSLQKKPPSSPKYISPQRKSNVMSSPEGPSTNKRSKYLRSRVDYIMDTNIDSAGSQSQSSQSDVVSGNEVDDQYENAREILKFIHKISARYNLTHEEAKHCLWVNNGSFDDTVAWILTGYNCNGLPPWDHRDDEGLNSADGIKRLIKKYGIEAVHERQYFLEL